MRTTFVSPFHSPNFTSFPRGTFFFCFPNTHRLSTLDLFVQVVAGYISFLSLFFIALGPRILVVLAWS